MAYEGEITFMNTPSGSVAWNREIELPFMRSPKSSWLSTSRRTEVLALGAKASDFNIPAGTDKDEAHIFYDNDDKPPSRVVKCVIIGSLHNLMDPGATKHYILAVYRKESSLDDRVYERVGVGFVSGQFIKFQESAKRVSIE